MLGLGSSDGPRRRLQAELQALAAAAAAQGDGELVRTLDPEWREGREPAVATSIDHVPAELVGLAAQRGLNVLVTRLIALADAVSASSSRAPSRTTPLARLDLAPPSGPERLFEPEEPKKPPPIAKKPDPPKQPAEIEKKLRVCVGARLEAALLAGDHDIVAAMHPEYDRVLTEGHLTQPALAHAVPALVELAARRREQKLLEDLRDANVEAWAKARGDHATLSWLKIGTDKPSASGSVPSAYHLHAELLGASGSGCSAGSGGSAGNGKSGTASGIGGAGGGGGGGGAGKSGSASGSGSSGRTMAVWLSAPAAPALSGLGAPGGRPDWLTELTSDEKAAAEKTAEKKDKKTEDKKEADKKATDQKKEEERKKVAPADGGLVQVVTELTSEEAAAAKARAGAPQPLQR
jgi:hypothetical protein